MRNKIKKLVFISLCINLLFTQKQPSSLSNQILNNVHQCHENFLIIKKFKLMDLRRNKDFLNHRLVLTKNDIRRNLVSLM